jgi:O-antigen ligase
MATTDYRLLASKVVLASVAIVNLIILPDKAIDPINSPKLFALGIFGVVGIFVLVQFLVKSPRYLREIHFIVAILFLLHLTAVMLVSGRLGDQFYGVFGRNTGYLAFLSLIALFLCASIIGSTKFSVNLTKVLLGCGFLALAYGLLQVFELDPVNWGPSGYTPIFGFLGNPNFQSAFLGMTGSACLAFMVSKSVDVGQKICFGIGILLSSFVILKSKSEQGFLVLLSGILIVLMFYLYSMKNKFYVMSLFLISLGIGALSILGLTNKGPLAGILYKDSISFRGDYWRAAWKMGWENPATGVGLDRFGENYRGFRDLLATTRRGPDVTSNSAHNVFLDVFSNTGLIGLVLYLLLHLLTLRAIVKHLRNSSSFNIHLTALSAAWVAYVSQSIISVNQLGLAIWGWVLMGAILGYRVPAASKQTPLEKQKVIKSQPMFNDSRLPAGTLLKIYFVASCGAVISIWPLASDVNYVNALKSGEVSRIQASAYARPLQAQKFFDVANILLENKFEKESLQTIRDGVKNFPNTFELWKILSIEPNATILEVTEANRQMSRLDPLNPTLK